MAKMEEDMIDLVVTSPPYDNLRKYNGYSFDFESIACQLYRVMKPGGVIVWVVGDSIDKNGSESLTSFKQAIYFKECGFNIHDTMLYKKAGMRFPERRRYAQIFEYMFVISKGSPKTVNIIKDRPNRWAGHTNWGRNSTRDNEGNLIRERKKKDGTVEKLKDCKRYKKWGSRTNIWEYANGYGFGTKDTKIAYKHPATFPEQLVEDHIITWTEEGDIVYDPFMGSGTTAKMAILTNRKYIGSEISQEYVDGALHRISNLVAGSRLPIIQAEAEKRLKEEEEHLKMVEESEKKFSLQGKKWQPKQPEKV
ncbi:MAG TPA: site-specific DNA-methyltransferase [Bacteroidales bacterium]|nr:site-specific DNA-methyltransferase [Bacteroidales bacterium]